MENYRGIPVEHEPSDYIIYDDRSGEDEIGHEPPPVSVGQDERRMQVRAYNHWTSLLGSRNFPQIEDLISAELPDFAANAVVLDFSKGIENPAVTMLGQKLADECGADRMIKRLSDVPGRSLLSRITDHYMQILANQAPIGFEAEFTNHRGKSVVYRGILLPFSSDGAKIQHIMGVINWKELADPAMIADLFRELDDAAGADRSPVMNSREEVLNLGEWADGPVMAEPAELDAAACTDWGLADWLASARELAQLSSGSDDRSRAALYAAIGRAWDFALAAEHDPHSFSAIIADAGLKMQARAPMTPLVKLVFGPEYDKTRLTEFASALAHARRRGLERNQLAAFLAAAPGGLKGVVSEERKLRGAEAGRKDVRIAVHDRLADRLRTLPMLEWRKVSPAGSEFTMLLVRRLANGIVCVLGEVNDDMSMIKKAAQQLLR